MPDGTHPTHESTGRVGGGATHAAGGLYRLRLLKLSPKKRVCAIGTYAVDGLMQATLAGITTAAEYRVEGAAMYTGLMEWCRLRLARNYLSKLKFHLIILYQTNQLNYFLRCK